MTVVEAFRVAFSGLGSNRLRSALTMLGILIGVCSVILLVALGNGASVQVRNEIGSLGANVIEVYPMPVHNANGISQGLGSGPGFALDDVQALNDRRLAPDITTAVPVSTAGGLATYQGKNYQAPVTGTEPAYAGVRNYQLAAGSMFTDDDVRSDTRVAVIGQTVVDNLFGGDRTAALGQVIKVQGEPFQVVGVLAAKGSTGLGDQDNMIMVPISTVWEYLNGASGRKADQIVIEASSADAVQAAKTEATQVLLIEQNLGPDQKNFVMQANQDILNSVNQASATLTLVLGAIAAISLVVGGIGIMNIMLVTVTERTREIGIRKAIGARKRDVLLQFLVESMFLSGSGGVLGIALGAGLALWLDRILGSGARGFPPPVVSLPSVLVAFGVSVAIGLFFGLYPANRAASLNPIDALRYE